MENGTFKIENKATVYRRLILASVVLVIFFIWNSNAVIPTPWGIPSMLMVPVVISIGMFERENAGLFFGLGTGILMDAFSTQTVCFHSIMLTVAGYFSGVLITRLMRNNLKTCLFLNVIYLFIYNTVFYMAIYYPISKNESSYVYSDIYLASVVYTMLYVPLIYFIIRTVYRKSQ